MTTGPASLRPRRGAAATAGGLLLLALVVGAVLLRVAGGSWFVVETPSMGTTAPVGSLVLDTAAPDALRIGDIITFRPPTAPNELYTHRVVGIGPTGLLTTRGDINGAADGWRLPPSAVVGRVVAVLPGVGWLVRALPILAAALLLLWLLTARIRTGRVRSAVRILGGSAAVALAVAVLRPLTDTVVLAATGTAHGTTATVVSTGLLPVRVTAAGGRFVDLVAGQVGALRIPASAASSGRYRLETALHLPAWGWLLLAVACATPLVLALATALRRPPVVP